MTQRLLTLILFLMTISLITHAGDEQSAIAEQLNGLNFDEFLDTSYYILVQRDPELLIQLGLQVVLGSEEIRLTDVSHAYTQETDAIVRAIFQQLQNYLRDELTAEQQISYDIYHWYLDDQIRGQEFYLLDFPVTFFITAQQEETRYFFTDIHPLETLQDAEDYITRLWLVDDKFEQIIDNVNIRSEAGIIPPLFVIQWTLGGLSRLSSASLSEHDYYTAFAEKVQSIEELSESQREELLTAAATAIEEAVKPAYANLAATMTDLLNQAQEQVGLWQYPDGDSYYNYLLRHHTTTEMTVDEIHKLGLQELERIQSEMRLIFDELDYPTSASLPNLYMQLYSSGRLIPGSEVISVFEQLLADAQTDIRPVFNKIPEAEVVIIGGDVGGFYIPGSLDGTRPGAFYASVGSGYFPYVNMPSLLYHETVPGHHLQIAWAQELDLPAFRRSSEFTAYVEGWGLYAERLAWDLGWYEDDLYGDLGRLQYEAFRAARLVVDTGIHAKQWTFNQAVDFFAANTGFTSRMAQGEIARYVVYPGQANAYMIGMLEILEQRNAVKQALGANFSLADFHDLILDNGSMPLAILNTLVDDYIADIP